MVAINICCEATARAAFMLNYRTFVVSDANANHIRRGAQRLAQRIVQPVCRCLHHGRGDNLAGGEYSRSAARGARQEPGVGDRATYADGGFRLYDIKDPANPKLITFVKTHARGVHRFDLDDTYAYISTEMEGFVGNILVVHDFRNPSKPVEVSRWWMPGQNIAAGETPHPRGRDHSLHHAMRCGDEMYAGCWFSGISIIDVLDIARPRTLSRHEYDPPCAEPTHTFLKVPFPIRGKAIAVSTEEERPKRGVDTGKPHAPLRTWDVTDPTRPKILCTYQLNERAQPYHGDHVRFGTHQLREQVDRDCMLYVTWFAAGLRMINISDPSNPAEKGRFIPQPTTGKTTPWTNDVTKDERGLIYVTDKVCGLDIIEFDI